MKDCVGRLRETFEIVIEQGLKEKQADAIKRDF